MQFEIDLREINKKLKEVSDKDIADNLSKLGIKLFNDHNALILNGLAKRIPGITHSNSTDKYCLIWGG